MMNEADSNLHEFKYERVKAFNARARYHLGSSLGFDLKNREDSMDLARSLLTEYWDSIKPDRLNAKEYAKGMARLALGVSFLEDDSVDQMQQQLTEMVEARDIPRKEAYPREFTVSIAAVAAKRLKERFEESSGTEAGGQNTDTHTSTSIEEHQKEVAPKKRKTSTKGEIYRSPPPPDYSDPQDVIKYLFEAGIVSPSHAAALLVTLGFERPQDEMLEKLKNDINRVRSDLRARITTYRTQKHLLFDLEGVRILEAFLEKSINNPSLQLILDDKTRMVSVGSALVSIHQLNDVRNDRPPERLDKYDGTGTIIEFDE